LIKVPVPGKVFGLQSDLPSFLFIYGFLPFVWFLDEGLES
jgi:hypothetical protein